MKLMGVFIKSLREQMRSFWVLVLTFSMGPFFIFVYYLISESSKPQYAVLVVNSDQGIYANGAGTNHGEELRSFLAAANIAIADAPFIVRECADRNSGMEELKNKKADAMVVIPGSFSRTLTARKDNDSALSSAVEFVGDLTNTKYLISAVWANEIINEYALRATNGKRIIEVQETALGTSASIDEFSFYVPGLLIVSLIMLMFTASIAFVSEVENKTIMRLKLSGLSAVEFLGGVGLVQVIIGIVSVALTLMTAIILGFRYEGSLITMAMIAAVTAVSIIAFSLIIAAATRSAAEVLVVGNFPMFLFMFFTGAAFPLKSDVLFTVAGYPVNLQGLMTPTHAISALNKTLVMDMDPVSILPEMAAICALTAVYFAIGAVIFRQRHLKLT